jgi:hypothetical protein
VHPPCAGIILFECFNQVFFIESGVEVLDKRTEWPGNLAVVAGIDQLLLGLEYIPSCFAFIGLTVTTERTTNVEKLGSFAGKLLEVTRQEIGVFQIDI